MALQIQHPTEKGKTWPFSRAVWSIWTYAFNAAVDARATRRIVEALAQKGAPLTVDETKQAVKDAVTEVEQEAQA